MTNPDHHANQNQNDQENLAGDTKRAIVGGVVATLVVAAGTFAVGQAAQFEALALIQAMTPSARFLCSAVMTATATILALMLTALSLSSQTETKLKPAHYERVRQIALLDCITFIAAVLFLLLLTIPFQESDEKIGNWYQVIYYIILVYAAALGGTLISVVLMLYSTARDLIIIIHPQEEHDHLVIEKEKTE